MSSNQLNYQVLTIVIPFKSKIPFSIHTRNQDGEWGTWTGPLGRAGGGQAAEQGRPGAAPAHSTARSRVPERDGAGGAAGSQHHKSAAARAVGPGRSLACSAASGGGGGAAFVGGGASGE
jgi:hypothetical protein